MRIALAATLSLLAATALAGSAPSPPPSPLGPPPPAGASLPKDHCIVSRDVGATNILDQNTLLLSATGRNRGIYRLTMGNGCLRSSVGSEPLGFRYFSGDRICAPNDFALTARSGLCHVVSIVKLTPEETAALPRKLKP